MNSRGAALILVLTLVLTLATLATIGVGQITTQARYTHHSMSRVQAQYASQAGIVLALEQLRTGDWVAGTDCLNIGDCPLFDAEFPRTIQGQTVDIVIVQNGHPTIPNIHRIEVTVDYAHQ